MAGAARSFTLFLFLSTSPCLPAPFSLCLLLQAASCAFLGFFRQSEGLCCLMRKRISGPLFLLCRGENVLSGSCCTFWSCALSASPITSSPPFSTCREEKSSRGCSELPSCLGSRELYRPCSGPARCHTGNPAGSLSSPPPHWLVARKLKVRKPPSGGSSLMNARTGRQPLLQAISLRPPPPWGPCLGPTALYLQLFLLGSKCVQHRYPLPSCAPSSLWPRCEAHRGCLMNVYRKS